MVIKVTRSNRYFCYRRSFPVFRVGEMGLLRLRLFLFYNIDNDRVRRFRPGAAERYWHTERHADQNWSVFSLLIVRHSAFSYELQPGPGRSHQQRQGGGPPPRHYKRRHARWYRRRMISTPMLTFKRYRSLKMLLQHKLFKLRQENL